MNYRQAHYYANSITNMLMNKIVEHPDEKTAWCVTKHDVQHLLGSYTQPEPGLINRTPDIPEILDTYEKKLAEMFLQPPSDDALKRVTIDALSREVVAVLKKKHRKVQAVTTLQNGILY